MNHIILKRGTANESRSHTKSETAFGDTESDVRHKTLGDKQQIGEKGAFFGFLPFNS